jgi:putative transposase
MRKPYPTDLTDEQWHVLQPLIPPAKHGGRPRAVDMREVVNTLFYQNRSGCQWDMLPHDLLPKSTVYDYFAQWRDDGTWQTLLDALRRALRPPRSAASAAMTAARRSPGASVTSSWIPWGCCWPWR